MATKQRMIRKKIGTTTVEAAVYDLEGLESSTIKVKLPGRRNTFNEAVLRREVAKQLPREVRVIKILGIEVNNEIREMSEAFFLANSAKVKE